MAKVTGPLLSMDARGTLGGVVTYQDGFGKHRVTRKPVHRDAGSATQLDQRALFLEAVAYWKALSAGQKADWNATANLLRMTGYQLVLKEYMLGRLVEEPPEAPEGGFAGGLLGLSGVWLGG
jgi:hypothetical protein